MIDLQRQSEELLFRSSSNLTVIEARDEQPVPDQDRGWIKYPYMCVHIRDHAPIAIQLFAQRNLAGLASLIDILGFKRAISMALK